MSIHNYIERELVRKTLGTYFRKGKWVFHVLFLLLFWFGYSVKQVGPFREWTVLKLAVTAGLMLPFVIFFYTYCLYLIPYCFKQNKYRRFWILLLLLLALFPIIDYGMQFWAEAYLPKMEDKLDSHNKLFALGSNYMNFLSSFIGFSSLLYFMELLEGITTQKQTALNESQLTETELHRIKTQMNPDFMIRSLEGIIQLADKKDNKAPGSVIDFSDVLRYRLYRSKEKLVPLPEELTQLSNLMQLHNALPGQENTCSLETEGDPQNALVVPLSLINIAEPLLATFHPEDQWSMLVYLLVEEREIQVAVEITTDRDDIIEEEAQRIHEDLQRLLYSGLNFTVEKAQNSYSLRTCIPIFRNSIASS